ncbi:uncharacterized protein L201_001903 [Kwoniella dendrophila CBS 6074]|uniref:Uncharacterized protein n=1 Tax=Kwoniella dendrophila CBS 6074 TaxID=1295534 RepID=A0AAX4JR71_9TREE
MSQSSQSQTRSSTGCGDPRTVTPQVDLHFGHSHKTLKTAEELQDPQYNGFPYKYIPFSSDYQTYTLDPVSIDDTVEWSSFCDEKIKDAESGCESCKSGDKKVSTYCYATLTLIPSEAVYQVCQRDTDHKITVNNVEYSDFKETRSMPDWISGQTHPCHLCCFGRFTPDEFAKGIWAIDRPHTKQSESEDD